MTDTDIRHALERAAGDLSSPPDLLDRVRAGGRRRVVRRRAVLAGGLAAGLGGAFLLRPRDSAEIDPLTRGDLAGDRRFLVQVLAAWRAGARGHDTAGPVRVHWAGLTPAGPAALVSQPVRITNGVLRPLAGIVEPLAGGGLRVTPAVQLVPPGDLDPLAVLIGARRDVLVLFDAGRPVRLSTGFTFDAAGKFERAWPITSAGDGVSVHQVAPQADGVRIALRLRLASLDEPVELTNLGEVLGPQRGPQRLDRRLPGREPVWPPDGLLTGRALLAWTVTTENAYDDPFGYHDRGGPSWYIRGATPDRRRLVVETFYLDGDARVFCFLGGPGAPKYAGRLSSAALGTPVHDAGTVLHLRLPDQQGVVVAAQAAVLRYRTGGDWLPVSGDAALVPAAATELEVRPQRGSAVTVPLP